MGHRPTFRSITSLFSSSHRRQARSRSRNSPRHYETESLEIRTLLASQLVSIAADMTVAAPAQTVTVDVNYRTRDITTDPVNQNVQSLAAKIHFDSSQLAFTGFVADSVLMDGLQQPSTAELTGSPAVLVETDSTNATNGGLDGDPTTDKFVNVIWLQNNGGWPADAEPVRLYQATFDTLAGFTGATIRMGGTPQDGLTLEAGSARINATTAIMQQVRSAQPTIGTGKSAAFEVPVTYATANSTTTPANQNVQSLGLKIHFDPSQVAFKGFKTDTVASDGLQQPSPGELNGDPNVLIQDDTNNLDGDPLTTKYVNVIWLQNSGGWATGADANGTAVPLYTAMFESTANFSGSNIQFSGVPQDGFQFDAAPARITFGSLDVDGNGQADALSDGILILRFMANFTGTTLTDGVVDTTNGTRTDAASIIAFLQSLGNILDVDGNGMIDTLSDGILILRSFANFTGDALINGVVDTTNGTRTTAPEISTYLAAFVPPPPASGAVTGAVTPQSRSVEAVSSSRSADTTVAGFRALDTVFHDLLDNDDSLLDG